MAKKTKQKQERFECDCCGRVLTPTQMKIEKKINTELSPCFCNIIIELDRKNKQIKKLKKANSRYFSYLMERDDFLDDFREWEEENYGSN